MTIFGSILEGVTLHRPVIWGLCVIYGFFYFVMICGLLKVYLFVEIV